MEPAENHALSVKKIQLKPLVLFRHAAIVIIILIALGLRLGYVSSVESYGPPIRADAAKYYRLSHNLTENGIYSLNHKPPYNKDKAITPGYPLFLSLIMLATPNIEKFYYGTLYVQAVLSTLTVVLIYFLFNGILPWPALAGGVLLLSLSPHLTVYSGYVLTETLFTFLMVTGMFYYRIAVEKKSLILHIITGSILGMAALTRPALLLFPIALLVFAWLFSTDRKLMLKGHLLILCGLLALWLPWKIFTLDAPPTYSAPAASFALGSYPDLIFKTKNLRGYPYREDPVYNEMILSLKTGVDVTYERAREKPGKYLTWYLFGKPKMFWGSSSVAGAGGAFQYPIKSSIYNTQNLPKAIYQFMMFLHGILAALAMFYALYSIGKAVYTRTFDSNQFMVISSGLLLLYFTSIHMVLAPLPRYAVPLYPFCYILAVGAVSALVNAAVKFSGRKIS